ncbi:MAG: hypothetical protein LBJ89_00495 [Holosporales bacterium]|jgi:hypothetical protein|nr:hypothetical protein [Holosporales bacterium]
MKNKVIFLVFAYAYSPWCNVAVGFGKYDNSQVSWRKVAAVPRYSRVQLSQEQLKLSLSAYVDYFCLNKKYTRDSFYSLEGIVQVANLYISTHNPPRWDYEGTSWFVVICRPLQFCSETRELYSRICTAIDNGVMLNPEEERQSMEEVLTRVK